MEVSGKEPGERRRIVCGRMVYERLSGEGEMTYSFEWLRRSESLLRKHYEILGCWIVIVATIMEALYRKEDRTPRGRR